VSQDNENKPEDIDFDFDFGEEKTENGTEKTGDEIGELFLENPFGSALSDEAGTLQNETELPENENLSFSPIDNPNEGLGEVPSTFLADESFLANESETTASDENSEPETAAPEININTDKKNRKNKNKEKDTKPKTPKKETKKGEAIELGTALCLVSGGLLLLALIAVNVILLVFPPYKELEISFSSTIYYLAFFDLIGGVGIVAVPFLFYWHRKENDLFQTLLGVSVMALSFAVLLLMTELFRYDYTRNPASTLPTIAPVVLSNPAPAD
jgi:hypothetical protein